MYNFKGSEYLTISCAISIFQIFVKYRYNIISKMIWKQLIFKNFISVQIKWTLIFSFIYTITNKFSFIYYEISFKFQIYRDICIRISREFFLLNFFLINQLISILKEITSSLRIFFLTIEIESFSSFMFAFAFYHSSIFFFP